MTGFEPATSWSQTTCSTKLSHIPIYNGALEGIRTPDLLVRSQTLYPAELRAQMFCIKKIELINGGSEWNRTIDTGIFSPLLYRLSYQGIHLATRMGLEPTTSSVTGQRSNQLNYRAKCGGNYRARTCDPLLVRQMLSQLS